MRRYIRHDYLSDLSECRPLTVMMSHPGRRILQDVGFQLLHEHLVVEGDDGVIVALRDQHVLKGLHHTE